MTERGPRTGLRGAPGPAGPSTRGDPPGTAARPTADLSAVRHTDAIIESLAARRVATAAPALPQAPAETPGSTNAPAATSGPAPAETPGSTTSCGSAAVSLERATSSGGSAAARSGTEHGRTARQADEPDPAVRLLHALIVDVDDQGSGRDSGPEPGPSGPSGPGTAPRRRGPRTIVALGVAGAVLAGSGVAAGGAAADHTAASQVPSVSGAAEGAEGVDKQVGADTEAVVERRRTPVVRPAPERTTGRRPGGGPREYEPIRSPLRFPFPDRPRPRRPDDEGPPAPPAGTTPLRGTDDPVGDDDPSFDDLHKRAQKRFGQYENPYLGRD